MGTAVFDLHSKERTRLSENVTWRLHSEKTPWCLMAVRIGIWPSNLNTLSMDTCMCVCVCVCVCVCIEACGRVAYPFLSEVARDDEIVRGVDLFPLGVVERGHGVRWCG
jgi:hypothetical protein